VCVCVGWARMMLVCVVVVVVVVVGERVR
jgi:hypothetical protein